MLTNINIKKSKIITLLWSLPKDDARASWWAWLERPVKKLSWIKVYISKGLKRKSDLKICLGISIVQTIPIKCRKTCQYLPLAEFAHHIFLWHTQGLLTSLLISTHHFHSFSFTAFLLPSNMQGLLLILI